MSATQVLYIRVSAAVGALAVVFGAFGAHGLEERLSPEMLEIYHTGVLYHLVHAPALFALAVAPVWSSKAAPRAAVAWLIGIAIFSGTLYLLAVTGMRWLGAITPIGGVALIVGWVLVAGVRPSRRNDERSGAHSD